MNIRLIDTLKAGFAAGVLAAGIVGSAIAADITVATDTAFVPFEFKKDGKYVGFDIDIIDELTKRMGITYELKPMDFNGIIPALQTNNIDMAVAGMTMKAEREKAIDFSHPYYNTSVLMMVRSETDDINAPEDMKGKVVAVKTGTTSVDIAKKFGAGEIKQFPNIDGAYLEVRSGNADVTLYDAPNILYYIKTAGDGEMKSVGPEMEAQTYGMAFPTGSELREKINVALLEMMEDGTYAKIYREWFGKDPS